MSLATGTKLGAFEILSPLGRGGMGEVYKARDTRLERTVAIKVLPSHLADNAELKKRFEQEARAISSLNHPNICTLYDIGRENGIDFIVMELLEGETLSERLKKGALPLEDALRIGIELAEALDKAHHEGVVHRDVKPGNVMLTPPGAKLLDFGLAKRVASASSSDGSSLSSRPTEAKSAKSLTSEGAIIGTFQYMAPEQLEGDDVDARTDIFALGAVLYEMVTGRKAFEGKSQASSIGAIMKSDPPPVHELRPTAPRALDHVVRTCLAKDKEERWQSARDVGRGLRWVAEAESEPSVEPRANRLASWKAAAILALTALTATLVTWAVVSPREPESPPLARFTIELPAETPAQPFIGLALSPDGNRLVYVGQDRDGQSRLYMRSFDALEAVPISGTEGAVSPFFSPDGESIAFFAGPAPRSALKRVLVRGGAPVTLTDVSAEIARGGIFALKGSWGDDGTIVYSDRAASRRSALYCIPAAGGTPEQLTNPDPERGEVNHGWPHVLPDGSGVVFSITTGGSARYVEARIALLSLETGTWETLVERGYNARYVASGHLLYGLDDVLMAAPFDLARAELQGPAVSVAESVAGSADSGSMVYAVSPSGSLVFLPGADVPDAATLVWVDREGREETLATEPRAYRYARISPDGTRVAIEVRDREPDIWIWDLERETLTRLTFHPGGDQYPVWTPDSQRIVYSSTLNGDRNLFLQAADGSGTVEQLTEISSGPFTNSISPDGKHVVFRDLDVNLFMVSLDGERPVVPLVATEFAELNGEVAPNGRFIAYQSNASGQQEIYVRPFPNVDDGQSQVSTRGGTRPLWSPDGRELFYLARDGRLMGVPVNIDDSFTAGAPQPLFDRLVPVAAAAAGRPYDISPDGKRFLLTQTPEMRDGTSKAVSLRVVLNWFEELKERVPPP